MIASAIAGLAVPAVRAGRLPARTRLAPDVEVLNAVGGLPAHLAGRFEEPTAFVQATTGEYLVLDRRAHGVYGVDAARSDARRVLETGFDEGQVSRRSRSCR